MIGLVAVIVKSTIVIIPKKNITLRGILKNLVFNCLTSSRSAARASLEKLKCREKRSRSPGSLLYI